MYVCQDGIPRPANDVNFDADNLASITRPTGFPPLFGPSSTSSVVLHCTALTAQEHYGIGIYFSHYSSLLDFSGMDVADDDADTFPNWLEVLSGTDPFDPSSQPQDADGDGVADAADFDADGDGFSNFWEVACGTKPLDASSVPSDCDTFVQYNPAHHSLIYNAGAPDTDGDGVSDRDELEFCLAMSASRQHGYWTPQANPFNLCYGLVRRVSYSLHAFIASSSTPAVEHGIDAALLHLRSIPFLTFAWIGAGTSRVSVSPEGENYRDLSLYVIDTEDIMLTAESALHMNAIVDFEPGYVNNGVYEGWDGFAIYAYNYDLLQWTIVTLTPAAADVIPITCAEGMRNHLAGMSLSYGQQTSCWSYKATSFTSELTEYALDFTMTPTFPSKCFLRFIFASDFMERRPGVTVNELKHIVGSEASTVIFRNDGVLSAVDIYGPGEDGGDGAPMPQRALGSTFVWSWVSLLWGMIAMLLCILVGAAVSTLHKSRRSNMDVEEAKSSRERDVATNAPPQNDGMFTVFGMRVRYA